MAIRLTGSAGTWTLPEGDTILGRGAGSGIVIPDRRLSRQHARFRVVGQQVMVEDLGTTNGVLVDGDRITGPTPLVPGASVVCGPLFLTVEITDRATPPALSVTNATMLTPASLDKADLADLAGPTRRRTETMDPQLVVTLAEESRGSRKIAPAIITALHQHLGESGPQPTDQEVFHSGPLAPGPRPTPMVVMPQTSGDPSTTHLHPAEAGAPGIGALQPAMLPPMNVALALGLRRVGAAAGDVLQLTGLGLAMAIPLALLGLAAALHQAGAALTADGIALPPPNGAGPASIGTLLQLLPQSSGSAILALLRTMRELNEIPVILPLFLSLAGATLAFELPLLLGLVAATVRKGGPWWHRRLGLGLVLHRNGHRPSWGRTILRWLLFALCWPLALVTVWSGCRSLHDVLCGTEVRPS